MILITDHQITAAVNLEDAEGDIKIITNQMLYRHLFANRITIYLHAKSVKNLSAEVVKLP